MSFLYLAFFLAQHPAGLCTRVQRVLSYCAGRGFGGLPFQRSSLCTAGKLSRVERLQVTPGLQAL